MAGKGRTKVIYKGTFISKQSLGCGVSTSRKLNVVDFLIKVNSIAVVVIFILSCKFFRLWIKVKITKQERILARGYNFIKGKVEKFKHFCRNLFDCFKFAIEYRIFLLFNYGIQKPLYTEA